MSESTAAGRELPSDEREAPGFKRALAGSMVGAVLEWYDFAIYGALAASIFAGQFFPESAPYTGTLLALGTQAVGFIARPLGAIFFGHLGDRVGRKPMLIATYLILALATAMIGLLPNYAAWGLAAPILLVVLRFVQGFALGGEFGAAVTLVAEYAKPQQRGRWAALPQSGGAAGTLLATGVLTLIGSLVTPEQFAAWGWRIAFLIAIPLLLVGAWLRYGVQESPVFQQAERHLEQTESSSVLESIKRSPRMILHGLGARIGENVAFYIYTVFVIAYATKYVGYAVPDVLRAVLFAAMAQFVGMIVGGWISDYLGRKPVMIAAALGLAIWAPIFFALAQQSLGLLTLGVVVGAFLHGLLAGPEAAWLVELFPTRYRYAGSSIAFQGSSIIAGGPAPLIATALLGASGNTTAVVIYLVVCALITVVAVATGPETKGRDLASVGADGKSG